MNDIGLIIAGCKGGYRVLCSNGVVDAQSEEVKRTLSDVRSVIRFNSNHLTVYALEFTSQHKVYSVYRSCNDTGTGAFINILLFVPHGKKIQGVRHLLDNMIDCYFKEYVSPIHGTYYAGKYDDITPFADMLRDVSEIQETDRFTHERSKQDDTPRFYIYTDVTEVDSFFASPYRKEFFNCQEVMFLSKVMYDKGSECFIFNGTPSFISKVSEPEKMPHLNLNRPEVVEFAVNGDLMNKETSCPVNMTTDNVEISVKYRFCRETKVYGQVSQLVSEGKLVYDELKKEIFLGKVDKVFDNYCVNFCVNNSQCPDGLISIGFIGYSVPVKDSQAVVSGDKLENLWDIFLHPIKDNVDCRIPLGTFKPYDFANKTYSLTVYEFSFNVSINGRVKQNIYVDCPWSDKPISLGVLKEDRFTLYFPARPVIGDVTFDAESPEVEISFDFENKTLMLRSKVVEYELMIPEKVKGKIGQWDFKIKGESKKKRMSVSNNVIKINVEDDINSGDLIINDLSYKYTAEDGFIKPQMIYVEAPEAASYTCVFNGSRHNFSGSHIFPFVPDPNIIAKGYQVKKISKDGIYIYELRRFDEGTGYKGSNTQSYYVNFNGCHELYYSYTGQKYDCTKGFHLPKGDKIQLFDKKSRELCVIFGDPQKFSSKYERQARENGVTVAYNASEKTCNVNYKKPNSIVLIVILALLVFALAVGLGFIAWYFMKPSERVVVADINVELMSTPALGQEIALIEVNDKNVNAHGKTLSIYWNKKAAKKQYDDLLNSKVIITLKDKTEFIRYFNKVEGLDNVLKNVGDKAPESSSKKKDIKWTIETDLQTEVKNAKKLSDWESLVKKAPNDVARTTMLEMAKPTNTDIKQLQDYLKTFEKYKDSESYKEVEQWRNAAELKNQQQKKLQDLQRAAYMHYNNLRGDCCTDQKVIECCNWWKTLTDADKAGVRKYLRGKNLLEYFFDNAVQGYPKFFNNKIDELTDDEILTFSEVQRRIIDKYKNRKRIMLQTYGGFTFIGNKDSSSKFINDL